MKYTKTELTVLNKVNNLKGRCTSFADIYCELSDAEKKALHRLNRRKKIQTYRDSNPEKVKHWRATATVNAYKKLIAEYPEYAIDKVRCGE